MIPERGEFRKDIQGIRGVAILLVVAYHAGVSWLAGGYVGVDVFFVLSGYLITGMLAREVAATSNVDFSEFLRAACPAAATRAARGIAVDHRDHTLVVCTDRSRGDRVRRTRRRAALRQHRVRQRRRRLSLDVGQSVPPHVVARGGRAVLYRVASAVRVHRPRMGGRQRRGDAKAPVIGVAIAGALSFVASVWVTRVAQPWAFFGMPTRNLGVRGRRTRRAHRDARLGEERTRRHDVAGGRSRRNRCGPSSSYTKRHRIRVSPHCCRSPVPPRS